MNSKLWIRRTVSSGLMVAILATYSMVALANDGKATGELTVSALSFSGDASFVTVNGEAAKSGRTVFSSSTIVTPENSSAVINMGKAGQIEIAPNSNITLSFDSSSAHADLNSGSVTVLNSVNGVSVTANGATSVLPAGSSASASGGGGQTNSAGTGSAWWLWAIVFGGAAVGVIITASRGNNNISLGGNGTVVSPTR